MAEFKHPQDRLPKKANGAEPSEYFTFTAGGQQYTMPNKTLDVVTPGYNRKNRTREDEDRLWKILEDLAEGDGDILDAFDKMTGAQGRKEWEQLQRDLRDHMGASPGE